MSEQRQDEDRQADDASPAREEPQVGAAFAAGTPQLTAVRRRIGDACDRAGRAPEDVRLVAVSKRQSLDKLRAVLRAGQTALGESYVQEWRTKHEALTAEAGGAAGGDVERAVPAPQWHFIGALQSNKLRELVGRVELIHGVGRRKLVNEIERRATTPQKILIQVNVSEDPNKSGTSIAGAMDLVRAAFNATNVDPVGLMTIPEDAGPSAARAIFERLAVLRGEIARQLATEGYDVAGFVELSMGMSGDFEAAIEAGATIVRVGSAIFGARD